ncbi:MAG: hypothetical protein JXL97_15945 [Bacteroidales bacterium]|nr:hypothetical protein [Bacteroidales bacterium]
MAKKKVMLMEHVWFGVGLAALTLFVINTISKGFSESYILLIFAGISFLMYLWRKNLRKKDTD